MIQADHITTIHEKRYLQFVQDKLGLRNEEVEEVKQNLQEYVLMPPAQERDRVMILYYLLFTLSSDSVVHEKEEAFLMKCSLQLGFRPDMIDNMLEILKKNIGQELPENALINEMKPFLN